MYTKILSAIQHLNARSYSINYDMTDVKTKLKVLKLRATLGHLAYSLSYTLIRVLAKYLGRTAFTNLDAPNASISRMYSRLAYDREAAMKLINDDFNIDNILESKYISITVCKGYLALFVEVANLCNELKEFDSKFEIDFSDKNDFHPNHLRYLMSVIKSNMYSDRGILLGCSIFLSSLVAFSNVSNVCVSREQVYEKSYSLIVKHFDNVISNLNSTGFSESLDKVILYFTDYRSFMFNNDSLFTGNVQLDLYGNPLYLHDLRELRIRNSLKLFLDSCDKLLNLGDNFMKLYYSRENIDGNAIHITDHTLFSGWDSERVCFLEGRMEPSFQHTQSYIVNFNTYDFGVTDFCSDNGFGGEMETDISVMIANVTGFYCEVESDNDNVDRYGYKLWRDECLSRETAKSIGDNLIGS